MNEMASNEIPLNWEVFVAKRQGVTRDLPPGKERLKWVAGSATLIYGARDAALVDNTFAISSVSPRWPLLRENCTR